MVQGTGRKRKRGRVVVRIDEGVLGKGKED